MWAAEPGFVDYLAVLPGTLQYSRNIDPSMSAKKWKRKKGKEEKQKMLRRKGIYQDGPHLPET